VRICNEISEDLVFSMFGLHDLAIKLILIHDEKIFGFLLSFSVCMCLRNNIFERRNFFVKKIVASLSLQDHNKHTSTCDSVVTISVIFLST